MMCIQPLNKEDLEKLKQDMVEAMKNKDKDRLTVIEHIERLPDDDPLKLRCCLKYALLFENYEVVYKLITKNSIEEKIYELQNRKEALIDNMLSTETTFINKLSKEEIMQLFE